MLAPVDKTRLTEYAAVHAHRRGVAPGTLAAFLHADGGLKGVVAEERRLRKQGKPSDGR